MTSEIIISINKKVDELLAKECKLLDSINERIEIAEQAISTAMDNYTDAYKSLDEKAYQKASQEQRNALDLKNLYLERMKNAKEVKLINEEEYKAFRDAILQELEKINIEGCKKIIELVDEIQKISDQVDEEINEGNKVLYKLQHDAYKEDCCVTTSGGCQIHIDSFEASYKARPISRYLARIKTYERKNARVENPLYNVVKEFADK